MNSLSQILGFLGQLASNNNREWFRANKDTYDSLRAAWVRDIELLRERMAVWEPELRRQPLNDCFYRIYRDTRFSPDKTPYKTYFSVAFSPYGRKTLRAAYYFQTGICESGIYGGIWNAGSDMVRKLRRAISDNDEEFSGIITPILGKGGYSLTGEALKTAPKGFSPDDPMIEFLRRKQLGVWRGITPEELMSAEDWTETVSEEFRRLKPLTDFINYSFDE